MAQPQFWLKVRKDYVMDNLNSLISYLSRYTIQEKAEENLDFTDSLKCMTEIADDIFEQVIKTPIYQEINLEHKHSTIFRLYTAIVLAERKSGITNFKSIIRIASLIARLNLKISAHRKLIDIVYAAMRKQSLQNFYVSWADIANDEAFLPGVFVERFLLTTFAHSTADYASFYEDRGLFILPKEGCPILSTINLENYKRYKTANIGTQYNLEGFLKFNILKNEVGRVRDFNSQYLISNTLLSHQDAFKPSSYTGLKEYAVGDSFLVRVLENNGYHIIGETIDPEYRRIKGKIYIKVLFQHTRPHLDTYIENVNKGDYFRVRRSGNPECAFEVADELEKYYREYALESTNQICNAIPFDKYPDGEIWLTEEGVTVAIHKSKMQSLTKQQRNEYREAFENGRTISLLFYSQKANTDKEEFFQYAEPYFGYGPLVVDGTYPVEDAYYNFVYDYFNRMAEQAEPILLKEKPQTFVQLENTEALFAIITILSSLTEEALHPEYRLNILTSISFISNMLERDSDAEYWNVQRRYLLQTVNFSANTEVQQLNIPLALSDCKKCAQQEEIIRNLTRYRKKEVISNGMPVETTEIDTLEIVRKLVQASNSLLDIIDMRELNNIKHLISRTLGVEEEYRSILDSRTFYGVENINLEFKSSAVFLPKIIQGQMVADPDLQKWNIIKAVNSFLNSQAGGDLLIGVNDAGYAVGLDLDLTELTRKHYISTPDFDHYRTYLQTMLDRAFSTSRGSEIFNIDISRSCVQVMLETTEEKVTIIRVKVSPYTKGTAFIVTTNRPDTYKDAYVRDHGRSIALNK